MLSCFQKSSIKWKQWTEPKTRNQITCLKCWNVLSWGGSKKSKEMKGEWEGQHFKKAI